MARGDPRTFQSAEDAYGEYLRRLAAGDPIELEDFCLLHPRLAPALRWIHSIRQDEGRFSTPPTGPLTEVWSQLEALGTQVGDRIGPYVLRKEIGTGGFGTVFLAEQEEPVRREVALKVLQAGSPSRELLLRFRAECQALAAMEHPGIAKLLDAGVSEKGSPWYAMELVRGGPINSFCDERRLSIPRRLALFVRICLAVQHAHSKGFIHRDLKPLNVLVDAEEGREAVPKVIDFGLAKVIDDRFRHLGGRTRAGDIMGTPAFMSPEQILDPLAADARSDIYSLGVMLFQLLSGALPFRGDLGRASPGELERIIARDEPLTLVEAFDRLGERRLEAARRRGTEARPLRRLLGSDLAAIAGKAMAREPGRRYATVAALAEDMERYLGHLPVQARRPGLLYSGRKLLRRHRVLAGTALALAAVGTVGLLAVKEMRDREREGLARGAFTAIAEGDVDHARSQWEGLRAMAPGSPSEHEVGNAVLEALIDRGERHWKGHSRLLQEAGEAREQWLAERDRLESWAPSWERAREIELEKHWQDLRSRFDTTTPLRLLHDAWSLAGPGSAARRRAGTILEDIYLDSHLDRTANQHLETSPEELLRMVERYGTGRYAVEIAGRGGVRLSSDPPGATVHCFRYEPLEGRLVPRPFHPQHGIIGEPFLRIGEDYDPADEVQTGDRLQSVDGKQVQTLTELAAILRDVDVGQRVRLEVQRGGALTSIDWTPFTRDGLQAMQKLMAGEGRDAAAVASLIRGRIVHPYFQFLFTFEGYPLELREENRVGVTSAEAPLELDLPRGSYLLVLRKEGRLDVRYPVVAPRVRRVEGEPPVESVTLPALGDVPRPEDPGRFIWIPGGDLATGGDDEAFQSLEAGVTHVAGFFLERLEVGSWEWLEFVNDPEVLARTDASGVLTRPFAAGGPVLIVPGSPGALYWRRNTGGRWERASFPARNVPIFHVSRPAAEELAAWRTRRAQAAGERWRYRLPSDEEWEYAARGADRRAFPWGNYLVASDAWCHPGTFRAAPAPEIGGISPLDESVFGVRDLAGSSTEHTSGSPRPGYGSYRGGSWDAPDEYFLRSATRNGLQPGGRHRHSGVRLAAERIE